MFIYIGIYRPTEIFCSKFCNRICSQVTMAIKGNATPNFWFVLQSRISYDFERTVLLINFFIYICSKFVKNALFFVFELFKQ